MLTPSIVIAILLQNLILRGIWFSSRKNHIVIIDLWTGMLLLSLSLHWSLNTKQGEKIYIYIFRCSKNSVTICTMFINHADIKKSNLDVPLELQAGGESLHQASLPPLWLPTFGHHYWYRWWLNRKKIMILDMTITKAEVICRHLLPIFINVNFFQP